MVDGLSLASSIVTFINAISKLKDTLSKARSNDERLQLVINDIFRGLAGIERLCCARYSTLNESQAMDLKEALDDLRSDMMQAQARAEKFLTKRSTGFFASTASRAKAWLRRSAIEAEAVLLETRIRACYMRFLTFTAARTEYAVLVNHQEHMEHLEHMEDLVSYMLVRNNRDFMAGDDLPDPDEIDYQFAHRQVVKLIAALDWRGEPWLQSMTARPEHFLDFLKVHWTPYSRGKHFRQGLHSSLDALHKVKANSAAFITDFITPMLEAAGTFLVLRWHSDSRMMLMKSTEILHLSQNMLECTEYKKVLAYCQLFITQASVSLEPSVSLSFAKNASKLWQEIYDRYPDEPNLLFFKQTIQLYDVALFRDGQYEESLDCSRQALLLLRMAPAPSASDAPLVTWSASGEADVVFSSEREVSRTADWTIIEGHCLWNLAKSLAFAGRYMEGRIAAEDAVKCREAFPNTYPHWVSAFNDLTRWRTELSTWVSIIENPSTSPRQHSTASIEEIDEPE